MHPNDLAQLDQVTDTFEPNFILKSEYYNVEEFGKFTNTYKSSTNFSILNTNSRSQAFV